MITMKTDTQIKFDTIIKDGFTPLLKPLSFKKKALNYYRQLSEVGHIVNIQKDRYSHRNHIKFRINIGIFEPKFWAVRYDFKHTEQVPDYPTEPVCLIRNEIHNYTDEQKLIKEIQEDIQQYILPFFDQLDSIEKILLVVEKDSNLLGITFDLLIFYAEHGQKEKAQTVYNQLLQKVNPLAESTLEGLAKKYGLNV